MNDERLKLMNISKDVSFPQLPKSDKTFKTTYVTEISSLRLSYHICHVNKVLFT